MRTMRYSWPECLGIYWELKSDLLCGEETRVGGKNDWGGWPAGHNPLTTSSRSLIEVINTGESYLSTMS